MKTRRQIISGGLAAIGLPFLAKAYPVRSMLGAEGVQSTQDSDDSISAASYVQEGLVSIWDGIENIGWGEHSDTSDSWVELISNTPDKFIGILGSGFSWDENSNIRLVEGRNGCFISNKTDILIETFRNCSFTVESVTSSPIASATYQAQIYNICNSISDGYNANIIARYRRENNGTTGTVSGGKYPSGAGFTISPIEALYTCSCSYNNGAGISYANGVYVSSMTATPSTDIEGIFVRLGSSSYAFRGHYHCLRIYNRPLSEEEVIHNYTIDKYRFGTL